MKDAASHTLTAFPDAPDIESSTDDYASRFSGPVGDWFIEVQRQATLAAIRARFPEGHSLSILDVGGGHCQNLYLAQAGGHHLTILGSTDACGDLLRRSPGNGPVEFVSGRLAAQPFEANAFDVVICYRCLSHIDDWQRLCGELARVARQLVIVDYADRASIGSLGASMFAFKQLAEGNARRYRLHRGADVDAVFEARGFRQAMRFRQFFLPMALHRRLNHPRASRLGESAFRKVGLTAGLGSPTIASYAPVSGDAAR